MIVSYFNVGILLSDSLFKSFLIKIKVKILADIDFEQILKEIKPTTDESIRVENLSKKLLDVIKENIHELNVKAEPMLAGSVAKGTWLAGNADIDILIKFPLDTREEDLKKYGLEIGHRSIIKMSGKAEERYASHPYVTGFIEGYDVDFVPCYDIKTADELKSAVDRTLLHTQYIENNLNKEQIEEVVLLKKFMKSVGTYGSEFKVGGFAGYLCELLILQYGCFIETLEDASKNWMYGQSFDLEDHGTSKNFNDPLVAVDPVDKNRNVAASLKLQKMSEFVVASSNYLKNPSSEYFKSKPIINSKKFLIDKFNSRGTESLVITFKPPNIPADAVYPQIKKTEYSITKVAESLDFKVLGSSSWTDEKELVAIILEFETWRLPPVKKHLGPQIWDREHQERFLKKYGENAWIENDRWVVDIPRDYTTVYELLSDLMTGKKSGYLKFGKHLKKKIMTEHSISEVSEYLTSNTVENGFLEFLHLYINPGELLYR